MHSLDLISANLLSPMVLSFLLGIVATLVKSDLRIPDELYTALSIYLLLAIGLKGGVALSTTPLAVLWAPVLVTLLIGLATPLTSYASLRRLARFSVPDSAAMAAHYGSVSAVTFIASLGFVEVVGARAEGFLPALVALLEVPAIVLGLLLARLRGAGATGSVAEALREIDSRSPRRAVLPALCAGGVVASRAGRARREVRLTRRAPAGSLALAPPRSRDRVRRTTEPGVGSAAARTSPAHLRTNPSNLSSIMRA